MIEANWGDTFQITVTNQITGPEEGTILHWHGLLQHGTPWFDGVPAVDTCPIAPGKSFTYTFKADLYGTSWWHSHYSAQYADGLFGPMIIYGPKNADYDLDLGPVMLNNLYHNDYHYYIQQTSGIPFELPIADNNLINGRNQVASNCGSFSRVSPCPKSNPFSTFQFQTGKTHRFRLVNSGADGIQRVTIDGHTMTVIANDYVPVVPYEADVLTLGVGQRTDIIVKATANSHGAYWMRSTFATPPCGLIDQPLALAAIYYPNANTSNAPNTHAKRYTTETPCGNTPLASTVPLFSMTPPETPATTQRIQIDLGTNSSGNSLFFMNGVSFRGNYDHPVLPLAYLGNTTYPDDPEWNVYNFGSNSSMRFVIINNTTLTHPIHLHGHEYWVLAEGIGTWDGTITNPSNPQRRDVQLLQGDPTLPGYLVLQINADNPGVWPLHCHIAWHVSTGLYISVLEQPEMIRSLSMPSIIAQTCRDWADYTGHDVVDQIDSGL
ncbi:hypothetical protein MMC25_005470 [Agyrium rufum]|nr:hypothetical protein [Agyrium rufum]